MSNPFRKFDDKGNLLPGAKHFRGLDAIVDKTIAVVVPSIRPESLEEFKKAWASLFKKHNVHLIVVWDGDEPRLEDTEKPDNKFTSPILIMNGYQDVIFNRTAACRNLGFAYISRFLPNIETIITFDDDVRPLGFTDAIQDHIDVLGGKCSTSWLSTASEYMRGFPYMIRNEAKIVVSHGVWQGIPDWDGPTQLVREGMGRERDIPAYFRGPIPKGIYFPFCAMNVAFLREALPYMYQAPSGARTPEIHRWDDIWGGIVMKRHLDKHNLAAVSGYATIDHVRASNSFANVRKESRGLEYNEVFWKGWDAAMEMAIEKNDQEMIDYFTQYMTVEERWRGWIDNEEALI